MDNCVDNLDDDAYVPSGRSGFLSGERCGKYYIHARAGEILPLPPFCTPVYAPGYREISPGLHSRGLKNNYIYPVPALNACVL